MLLAEASTGDSKKGHEWGFLNYRIRLYFVCPEFFGPCKCFQFATPFELTKLTKIRDFDQNHEFLSFSSERINQFCLKPNKCLFQQKISHPIWSATLSYQTMQSSSIKIALHR